MATMTQNIAKTSHLLALMKKGDDAFNARDLAAMKAAHHPNMIAHMPGSAEPIHGQRAHAEAMKGMISSFPDHPLPHQPTSHTRGVEFTDER